MSKATDHEVVSIYRHSDEQIDELMTRAPECVLMWGTQDHWPVGVVHSFVWRDGKVWLTFAAHRHRATAIRRDPRVSVCVSGRTSDDPDCPLGAVTLKGRAVFHDDDATKDWFYPAMAEIISPYPAPTPEAAIQHLDTPLRVIIELIPEMALKFDGDAIAKASSEGTIPGAGD